MRPCRYCGAAIENRLKVCPQCGRESTWPPPSSSGSPKDVAPKQSTVENQSEDRLDDEHFNYFLDTPYGIMEILGLILALTVAVLVWMLS